MSGAPAPRKARHLRIRGRVQGVFFRDSMCREAERLRITGWVRNREDGSVEALVQGAPGDVEAIVRWAHQGPPAAHVTQVDVEEVGADAGEDFQIRYR